MIMWRIKQETDNFFYVSYYFVSLLLSQTESLSNNCLCCDWTSCSVGYGIICVNLSLLGFVFVRCVCHFICTISRARSNVSVEVTFSWNERAANDLQTLFRLHSSSRCVGKLGTMYSSLAAVIVWAYWHWKYMGCSWCLLVVLQLLTVVFCRCYTYLHCTFVVHHLVVPTLVLAAFSYSNHRCCIDIHLMLFCYSVGSWLQLKSLCVTIIEFIAQGWLLIMTDVSHDWFLLLFSHVLFLFFTL